MSAVEEEVIKLLRHKFFVSGLDNQLCELSPSKLLEIYQLLLSVLNSDYAQRYEDEESSIKHICRCMRLLGLGHLLTKPHSLVDFRKAPRIITALEDKITARYGSSTAQRIRSVIKSLQNKKSKKVKPCKQVDGFEHQENEEPLTNLPKPTVARSSEAGIILTGRQIPRTPMRPLNACNGNSNLRQSLALSPEKHTGQQGTVTKKLLIELENDNSIGCENTLGMVADDKVVNEQVSIAPIGSRNSIETPLCRQLSSAPDLDRSKNILTHQHRFTFTEATHETELHQSDGNEKYRGPPPPYIPPPEEFCSDSLPQCVLNGQNERNCKDNFSVIQSYPSDGVPPNMGTFDLPDIENLPAVHNNKESNEITSHSKDKFKKFGQDFRTGNEIIPECKIALHEDIPPLFPNSSFQNMSGSPLPQTLSSTLANNIPLGRQLIRTPPLVVSEQRSEVSASCRNTSPKPKNVKTPDIVSVSLDISHDATLKESLGSTFIGSPEKECILSRDLHDSSAVTEVSPTAQKSANEECNLRQNEKDIDDIIFQELPKSTMNSHEKDDSLLSFHGGKQRKQKVEESDKGSENNATINKENVDENCEEQISTWDTSRRNSIFHEEKRLSILEEVPVLSASYSFLVGAESFSQSPKPLSVLENSIPTGRQLIRTPPLCMIGKDPDVVTDSGNTVAGPEISSDSYNSVSSVLTEKEAELNTGTGEELETVGSHLKQRITSKDISQIMRELDEEDSFEIFPKEKKTKQVKEKTDDIGGTTAAVVPVDMDDISKENLQNVGTAAETATGKLHDTPEENLQHGNGVLETVAPEELGDESHRVFIDRKTIQSEDRNTLLRIAVKKAIFNKRKGNRRMVCVEDDFVTDWKSCHQSGKTSRQHTKILEERSHHSLLESAHEDKQVCVIDDSLTTVSSEMVKESKEPRKTTKTQEEKFQLTLPKDLKGDDENDMVEEDESFEFFPKRRPIKSRIRNLSSKDTKKITELDHEEGKNQVCVEDSPGRDRKQGHQGRGKSKQKASLRDKKLQHVSAKDVQEGEESCITEHSFVEVCPKMDVRKSRQTSTLEKSTSSHKEESHHMLHKGVYGSKEQVCGTGENESLAVVIERSACSGNGNSTRKVAIEKIASNKGLSKDQVCVEGDLGTDKKPRNSQSRRILRQTTKIQEEKSHFVSKGAQEDIQVCMTSDSKMNVCSETDTKKTRRQTRKKQQKDTKVKGKEFELELITDIQEGDNDATSSDGMKGYDKSFTKVDEEILDEGNHDAISTVSKLRGRKKSNKMDEAVDSTCDSVSSEDQISNKVHKTTLRRTQKRGTNSVPPVSPENCQKFDSGRNVYESRGRKKGKNLKVKDCDKVEQKSTKGDTGEVLVEKKEKQHSETASVNESITHEASNMDSCRQIRKRQAKVDRANLEIPIVKTRGAKKMCLEKADSNTKEGAHSQEDLQSAAAGSKRRDTLRRVKKGKDSAISSPLNKAVNSFSADGEHPSENEGRKKTSHGQARVTRNVKSSNRNTNEMELDAQQRKRPAKTEEPVEILERSGIATNGVETRRTKKSSGRRETELLEGKTRRTDGSRLKDPVETSKTKKPPVVKETKSKKSRKKS